MALQPPVTRNLEGLYAIQQGSTYSVGFRVLRDGALIDLSAMDARMKIRKTDWDGEVQVDANTDNGRIVLGYSPGIALRNTPYVVGSRVIPQNGLNGYVYECTVAGTTHVTTPPTWPLLIGAIVTDGTVTWEAKYYDTTVANMYILLDPTYTASLVDWGLGVWDLELVDGSYVKRLYQGVARLSREATY